MGKGPRGRRGIPLSYLFLATLGYPFKWAKTRGGFRVEWLGMETEYPTYKLGLSLKRATWLVDWLRLLARTGRTEAKAFAQARETRVRLHCARLGTTVLGPATRLVFCRPGETWGPDATLHGPSAMRMASGPPGVGGQATEARAAT